LTLPFRLGFKFVLASGSILGERRDPNLDCYTGSSVLSRSSNGSTFMGCAAIPVFWDREDVPILVFPSSWLGYLSLPATIFGGGIEGEIAQVRAGRGRPSGCPFLAARY